MHVPGSKKNLFSVAMLEDRGYDVVFSEGKAFLQHKATGKSKKIGIFVKNLYKIDVYGCVALMGKAEKVVIPDEGEFFHKRLGHLHHRVLKVMQHISMILPKGILVHLDTCKGCTMGKYAKATFHEKDNRAAEMLERVHSYVCGPFSTASKTMHRYYVIFFDDFSRNYWIYFMLKKY